MKPINWVRVSLIAFLFVLSASTLLVAISISQALERIPTVLHEEAKSTREALVEQIALTRTSLNDQLDKLRSNVDAQLTQTRQDLNAQVTIARKDAIEQLNTTNAVLYDAEASLLEQTAPSVEALTENLIQSSLLLERVNAQEPMIYSRYLATTGELNKTLDALRLTANAVAAAAPEITENATKITGNVANITDDVHQFTKPKKVGFIRGTFLPIVLATARVLF